MARHTATPGPLEHTGTVYRCESEEHMSVNESLTDKLHIAHR